MPNIGPYKMFNFFHNAKEEPKIFYCKHIAPGVCAYADETILIGEETLKEMDKTFAGKPIYVNHQEVNLENLQEEADGYVAESFYLPEDGCHWAKMIIVSDKGQEAVRKGWKVSNAYIPDEFGIGGEWHNIPYNREIMKGHYTHLALVDNPRYEEAEIMTPEQFKMYKEEKRAQLKELENTKGEGKTMFKLFKKTEVTNSDDLSKVMVELSNGSAVSIGEMVNSVEAELKKEEEAKNKCNEADVLDKVVKVNGEDMTVADLIKEYEGKCNKCNEDEEKKPEAEEEKKDSDEEKEEPKAEEAKEDKENEVEDKRELIREVMAIAGEAGASEEQIRTIAEKLEKLAYDKDEAEKEGKKNEEPEEVKEDLTVEDKENMDPEFMKKAQPIIEEGKKKGLTGKALDEYVMEHLDAKHNAKELLEAEEKANTKGFQGQVVDTMSRKLARGQERYGSAK